MIQILADGALVYDSRLEEYDLQGLTVTTGLNKGGSAEITMPPHHPAYSRFVGYRTVVEIYRDGVLRFRGRALYQVDDYDNQRTVVCEGEMCFLQDEISRPYLYETDPASIFASVIEKYNKRMEVFKQFKLGTVTVTDPNDYIRLENESAETVLDTINKLLERCGGYIIFTTDPTDGKRVINWLESTGRRSDQSIELGENLLDFSRSGANTDLATGLVPYGTKNEETGLRLTIVGANHGRDYIVDEEAVAIRGTILKTVTWDEITTHRALLKKAQQYLNECKLPITSLTLTALDLSYIDKDIDSYEVGDSIRVRSKAHGLDEDFQLVDRQEDLLNPANCKITLGKEIKTLTGMDVAGDSKSRHEIQQTAASIKRDFNPDVKLAVDTALSNAVPEVRTDHLHVHEEAIFSGPLTAYDRIIMADGTKRTESGALPEDYEAILDNLEPVRFKYSDEADVFHTGLDAVNVMEAIGAAGLTVADFGGVVDLNGDGTELGLVYNEFIALLLQKIKRLETRIAALEAAK